MRVCSKHGCPTIYPASEGSRCKTHRQQARAARVDNKVYSSKGHRSFRSAVLTRDPICTSCELTLSTVADHYPLTRRELVDAGLNPNDPQHGRGLCANCHNTHTAATSPGGWNDRT
ncbi:5-methylcytosine-specific restriction protein A [Microterricola gilva]|uniref:5-methylcytosine-specific restriction protein A n=1 Tax=Microterricola gilva TaxID=393267 RepID=A0A4Q8AM03_9MICO|nr:5-methylcytosine-specific restriction protein A [Microterricola gilva]